MLGWTTSLMIVLERSRTLDLLKRPSSVRLARALRTFSITNSSVSEVNAEIGVNKGDQKNPRGGVRNREYVMKWGVLWQKDGIGQKGSRSNL